MAQRIRKENTVYRMLGWWFGSFGIAALLLACVGLYGVMAFSVSRRTGEIGVRIALGAQRNGVLSLILRDGVTQLAIGMVIGLATAVMLSRLIAGVLFQLEPTDPVTIAEVVLTLSATGIAACLIPARLATRVDPVEALRVE
jgi:putative ABC transport system permease protein